MLDNPKGGSKMKAQDILNKVVNHLFAQGKRAETNNVVSCIADDGAMCPVGLLIGEDYFPELEQNKTLRWLVNNHTDMFPEWFIENLELICELQAIHDKQHNWSNVEVMKRSLENLASSHNLKVYLKDHESFGTNEISDEISI